MESNELKIIEGAIHGELPIYPTWVYWGKWVWDPNLCHVLSGLIPLDEFSPPVRAVRVSKLAIPKEKTSQNPVCYQFYHPSSNLNCYVWGVCFIFSTDKPNKSERVWVKIHRPKMRKTSVHPYPLRLTFPKTPRGRSLSCQRSIGSIKFLQLTATRDGIPSI